MISSNQKRFIIYLLDTLIAVIIGFIFSSYCNDPLFFMIIFVILIIFRVSFDIYYKSIGEKLEEQYLSRIVEKVEEEYKIQKAIATRTIEAIEKGDIKSYEIFDELSRNRRHD